MGNEVIRASDAEREATIERLRAGLAEGRLDLGAYEQGIATALAATTRDELDTLTADLPKVKRDKVAEDTRAWYVEWRYWLAGTVVLFAIWGFQSLRRGEVTWPWLVVPLGIWAAILV